MAQSFTSWGQRDYPGSASAPFRVAETFGPAPQGHDYLDNLRMYWRRTPEATYPDGYLGTVPSRRGDRLMDGLKARTNNRPYTRGVHKGERIDARDYAWAPEFNLFTGLEMQSKGIKFAPPGLGEFLQDERYPTDRRVGPRGVPVGQRYANGGGPAPARNPDRTPVLQGQAPPWATGIRGNPGMAVPYPREVVMGKRIKAYLEKKNVNLEQPTLMGVIDPKRSFSAPGPEYGEGGHRVRNFNPTQFSQMLSGLRGGSPRGEVRGGPDQ